jgi:hypothetical protein
LGGLYRTTDGGSTWNLGPSATPAFNDLISLNDSTFVGAYHFSFYKSTDYGQTFHHDTIHRSSNSPFSTISFLDKQTGYMSTADGYIYRTSDAGAHWTLISASGFFNVRSILFTDVFHGYMITNYNIYTTFNGGSSWFFEYSSNKLLNKLAADANHVFVAGDSGLVLRKSIILPVSQLPVMNHSLELIPNPAGNTVMIKPDAEIEPGTVVEVLNTLGQTVYTQEYKTEADKVLSIASFNPGLYICRLMYKGEQTGYSRFLKE